MRFRFYYISVKAVSCHTSCRQLRHLAVEQEATGHRSPHGALTGRSAGLHGASAAPGQGRPLAWRLTSTSHDTARVCRLLRWWSSLGSLCWRRWKTGFAFPRWTKKCVLQLRYIEWIILCQTWTLQTLKMQLCKLGPQIRNKKPKNHIFCKQDISLVDSYRLQA